MSSANRVTRLALAASVIIPLGLLTPALAGEVTLKVKGGGLEVSGELKSFDGNTYVIEAPAVGTMSFDASRFDCIGENCTRRVSIQALPPEKLNPETPDRFSIGGSRPLNRALMPALIRGYASSVGAKTTMIVGTSPGDIKFRLADTTGAELATIAVEAGGPATAATEQQAVPGHATIEFSDRPPVASEISGETAAAAGAATSRLSTGEHIVGHDGLAIVVSPDNPLTSLSEDKLARIFSGQIGSWGEIGVPGGTISVYSAGRRSSAAEVFDAVVLGPRNLARGTGHKELASESDVADAVSRDANGIGVVSFAFQRSAKRLNLEGSCGLITRPTTFAVKAGEYGLSRPLYFVTGGVLNQPAARGLLRYAMSRDAQPDIAAQDFVDDRVEQLAFEEQTERMAFALNVPSQGFDMAEMRRLLADLKGARRLSLTFRFTSGSFDLAPNSRLDVLRLAEYMQSPELAGKTIMLIGFTDAEGRFGPNASISARRASQVRTAVLASADGRIADQAIVAKGFGPLAPIACNDTVERRQLNRRVEVWVKDAK
ncbi:MAG: phosphate ABC transporter substrate-binding/OmpA family protein [Hyphomicrobium sp.]